MKIFPTLSLFIGITVAKARSAQTAASVAVVVYTRRPPPPRAAEAVHTLLVTIATLARVIWAEFWVLNITSLVLDGITDVTGGNAMKALLKKAVKDRQDTMGKSLFTIVIHNSNQDLMFFKSVQCYRFFVVFR